MEKLNIKFLKLAVVTSVMAISSAAVAGPGFRMQAKGPVVERPTVHKKAYVFGYGGIDFGSNYTTDAAFTDLGPDYYVDPAASFDPRGFPINFDTLQSWSAGGGVGVYSRLFGGSRFEIDGSFTNNGVKIVDYADFKLPADLNFETKAIMFNYLKEIPLGHATGYLGGGIGYASTEISGDIDTLLFDGNQDGLAYQFIAGVEFPITESLAFFTQYRYRILSYDQKYTASEFGNFDIVEDESTSSHALLFGARVSF